jgi:predicted permease
VALVRELSARFAGLPGVTGATFSENGLFSGSDWSTEVDVPGYVALTSADSNSRYDQVGPGYFRTIGAPLIGGREFAEHDVVGRAPVVIVNQEFARFYFGAVNPIGRSISFEDSTNKPLAAEIVGLVGNVRTGETSEREGARSLTQPPVRRFYVPYLQHPGDSPATDVRFEIRTEGNPASVIDAARRVLSSIDPLLPTNGIYPLDARIHESIARERLLATLSTAFGVVALLLAAIGLYGLMMHAVGRRTGELGLRMALGAGRGDVVTMVLGEALRLVGAGLVLGIPAAYAATRVIRAQVSGVGAVDLSSVAVALLVLIAAAVAAAAIPAIRAGRVAPIVALQQE